MHTNKDKKRTVPNSDLRESCTSPLQNSPTVALNLQEATQKLFLADVEVSSEEEKDALKRLEQAIKILGRGAVRVAQKQKSARAKVGGKPSKSSHSGISDFRTSSESGVASKYKAAAKQPLNSPQISDSATGSMPQVH